MAEGGQDPSGLGTLDSGLNLIGRDIGGYRILSRLGAGGMGEVYRARDGKLGREVAIKVLPAFFAADPERLRRFEREARLLASLNHPHIGAIYGLEQADPSTGSGPVTVHALVLELVEGPTLADRIDHAVATPGTATTVGPGGSHELVSGWTLNRVLDPHAIRPVGAPFGRGPKSGSAAEYAIH